ncbi:universal stress protein [Muriicola soli]|uniref:Universal stress protein n=1 Tax=Muriicola soli TaxID=2507538 RepID=A0A411ED21_9FLAO|nr:universal stress protein [Muriicola soli]QBA65350.1 universal stress protein [Muriicola soli]
MLYYAPILNPLSKIQPFKTLLFGFAFSPSLEVNIMEVTRIAYYFNARLILLHVGEKTAEKEAQIEGLLRSVEYPENHLEVHWMEGNPVKTIVNACSTLEVDLLVLGALQHENMYQFYVGTIARNLTRKVNCSVLLMIKPSAIRVASQHVVVNGFDDPSTPLALLKAFEISNVLGVQQITIVEEITEKELHITVEDDETLEKAALLKEQLKQKEEARVRRIIENIPDHLKSNVAVKIQSIFGKRGYSIGHYAEVVRADLLVMNAPNKSGLLDRIFPHDIEYILSDLPTDVLIVRDRK